MTLCTNHQSSFDSMEPNGFDLCCSFRVFGWAKNVSFESFFFPPHTPHPFQPLHTRISPPTIHMSSTDSNYSQRSDDSQSPVIDGRQYGSESSVNDGEREELEVQKPAGVNEGYGSETYVTGEENNYSKPVEVDEVHDSRPSMISDGAHHYSKPQIDGQTCHSNAFKRDDGSEASTAVREGLDRQLWILRLLFEDLNPSVPEDTSVLRPLLTISLAKTDEGTYKMSSEQLWNEFSTVHDIRKKYDLNDEALTKDIREVAKCFAYESSSIVDYISERTSLHCS